MAHSNLKTYKRLLGGIVRQMNDMQPGADPKLVEKLNKKFKKYMDKVTAMTKQQNGTA